MPALGECGMPGRMCICENTRDVNEFDKEGGCEDVRSREVGCADGRRVCSCRKDVKKR